MRERKRRKWLFRFVLVSTDILATAAGFWLAYFIRFETSLFSANLIFSARAERPFYFYLQLFVLMFPVYLIVFFFFLKLYGLNYPRWKSADLPLQIVSAVSLSMLAVIVGSFLFKEHGISRIWLVLNWVFSVLLVGLGRNLFTCFVYQLTQRGIIADRILIIESDKEAKILVRQLGKTSSPGTDVIGYTVSSSLLSLVKNASLSERSGISSLPDRLMKTNLPDIITKYRIDSLFVTGGALLQGKLSDVIGKVARSPVDVYISPDVSGSIISSRMTLNIIAGIPFVGIRGASLSGAPLIFKRVFSLVESAFLLLILAPVFLIVALLIKLDSSGPVFYVQERVGKGGKIFSMYKFRTMTQDAHAIQKGLREKSDVDGPIFKIKDDPRITSVGKWLRRFSLDELPQLINVFKEEMALVGPRPLPMSDKEEADQDGNWWHKRHEVTPGITGLWQVRGRNDLSFGEMEKLDIFYVENWSLGLDLSILLRTIPAILSGKGAY